MTDVTALAGRLYDRICWQRVPEDVGLDEMTEWIADGIRHLYLVTGRALRFDEHWFIREAAEEGKTEAGLITAFTQTLALDEAEYVLLCAQIAFSRKAQSALSDLVSYTTDAMSVAHGDKPFANMQQTVQDLEAARRTAYYKMARYHMM